MRNSLRPFIDSQVFLNYPFDEKFEPLADAMSFAVVAANHIPLCALDLTTPDEVRLANLLNAIRHSCYSIHDLSRSRGEGPANLSRMNMPLELGMCLFVSLDSAGERHRTMTFVASSDESKKFTSDLSGLDLIEHSNDARVIVRETYLWLLNLDLQKKKNIIAKRQAPGVVVEEFTKFKALLREYRGSGKNRRLLHHERREVMYGYCEEKGWWNYRKETYGRNEFEYVTLVPKKQPGTEETKGGPATF